MLFSMIFEFFFMLNPSYFNFISIIFLDGRMNLKRSRSVSPQINNDLNVGDVQNALTSDGKKKRCRDYESKFNLFCNLNNSDF